MHEIVQEEKTLAPSKACEILNINASSYRYQKKQTVPHNTNKNLLSEIRALAKKFFGYGYRRITKALIKKGIKVNHKKVLKIMKEGGLIKRKRKSFKPQTTDSNHSNPIQPNRAKGLKALHPNQLWVTDITYIPLANGFAYLATIMDVFSRKIIGWHLGKTLEAEIVLNALSTAIENRMHLGTEGLILHSDRGSQFACYEYIEQLQEQGILPSMSRKGNVYDNAFAESFFKTLKYEEVNMNEYETFNDALENIEHFIEEIYNKERLHSSIGYQSPTDYEQEWILKEQRGYSS